MNVLFFTASLLPIYRTARFFVDRKLAVVIAAFAIAAPVHTYTAYFAPEPMYFFFFWIFVWFILSYLHRNPLQLGSGMGLIGALLTLVKPHGLILLGATTVFFLILVIARRRLYSFQWFFKVVIAMALLFLITRFGIGYILTGREGLDLFGVYRVNVNTLVNTATLPSLLFDGLHIAWGHLAGLILLFSVPIAICLSQLLHLTKPELDNPLCTDMAELSLFTLVLIGTLVVVVSKFTIDVAGSNVYETLTRLHARYYNFAFPLFLIITAAFIKNSKVAFISRFKSRVIIAVVLALGIVGAILSLHSFTPYFHDYPDLAWMSAYPLLFLLIGVLAILLMACWTVKDRLGAQGFLFLFFPPVAVVAGFFVDKQILLGYKGSAYDFGSLVTKYLINPEDRGKGAVVGEDFSSLLMALFQLDSQTDQIVQVPVGAPIESGMIASDRRWALIVGYHELKVPYFTSIKMQGFSVVGFAPGTLVASSQPWDGSPINLTFTEATLNLVSGFYPFDSYCMWSMTQAPEIELPVAINGKVRIRLLVQGYGPNMNRIIKLRLGSSESDLMLPPKLQEVSVVLSPDAPSKLLRFEGLEPASPAELEGSPDQRKLGMCLRSMSVQSE